MDELLRIFDIYDVSNRGSLPRGEILNVIRGAGVPISTKDAETLLLYENVGNGGSSNAAATAANKGKAASPASPSAAAANRVDISKQLMTKEDFRRFVAEKDFASKVVTAQMSNSGMKFKAQSDILAALQAFDYRENGYLTLGEVTNVLLTMNEKILPDEVDLALRGVEWFEGDGIAGSSKVRLEDLARHFTRHYSTVMITNEEVLSVIKS